MRASKSSTPVKVVTLPLMALVSLGKTVADRLVHAAYHNKHW